MNNLKQKIEAYSEIKEAYLVEKEVNYFPKDRFCILGIIRKKRLIESQEADLELLNLLVTNVQFSAACYIIILNHHQYRSFQKKIFSIPQSLILERH